MQGVKRLLIVTRRFWPCTNDTTLRLRHFCSRLCAEQWIPTILTTRWHTSWPCKVTVGGTQVVRLDQPPASRVREVRYRENVHHWLSSYADQFDAVFCDRVDQESDLVADFLSRSSLRIKPPLVVRFDPSELDSSRTDICLKTCCQATTVVVPTQTAHQHAVGMGIDASRLVRMSDWMVPSLDRSVGARKRAREMLAGTNADLTLHRNGRLLVVPGDFTDRWEVDFLIRALWHLVDKTPSLHVWILGDGPERERAYELLQHFGIHRIVAMPGMFTCFDAVLQAADICLFPGVGCGSSYLIPTCVKSGLPILAARTSDLESQLGPGVTAVTFLPASTEALRHKVENWLDAPAELEEACREIQRFVRRQAVGSDQQSSLTAQLGMQEVSTGSHTVDQDNHRLRLAR